MKKIIILGFATAVIALTSLTVSASNDEKYPAANFQPKVIYIDKESVNAIPQCQPKKAAEKATEFDPKYPAANFQPKVIYIDKESVNAIPQCQPRKSAEKATEFDPKYPATNFTPKVIYP